jgi:hypothetical protein
MRYFDFIRNPLRLALALAVGASFSAPGCMMDDDDDAPRPSPQVSGTNAVEREFLARAAGEWAYDFKVDGDGGSVWVDDVVTIGRNRHDIFADVYADEARTLPLFRYEARATLEVVSTSTDVPDGFNVDIRLTSATITAFVDDPALFAGLGLDDCNLVVDRAVDVMPTNCTVPLARDTTCEEKELYQIAPDIAALNVGAPTDRCVERPTTIDTTRKPYSLLRR